MKDIIIFINSTDYRAELNETETAEKIYNNLPLGNEGQFWGHEIYFEIPVRAENENPTEELEVGNLAYWPQGNSLCIFYGETPASSDSEPKPASPVTIVGNVKDKVEGLKNLNRARVKVTKG